MVLLVRSVSARETHNYTITYWTFAVTVNSLAGRRIPNDIIEIVITRSRIGMNKLVRYKYKYEFINAIPKIECTVNRTSYMSVVR